MIDNKSPDEDLLDFEDQINQVLNNAPSSLQICQVIGVLSMKLHTIHDRCSAAGFGGHAPGPNDSFELLKR